METDSKYMRIERKELKYYISYNEYLILRNRLKKILPLDKYHSKGKKGYLVRNLYFDTVNNKSFEEKMGGFESRAKYRLRIYDVRNKQVKFEIKNKFNNSVVKETAIISKEDAIELQKKNYEVMLKYKNNTLNKAYMEFKKHSYTPVVLVEYLREAFTCDANRIRIVFDRFLRSSQLQHDIFKANPVMMPQLKKEIVVMEIKYDHFVPKWIKDMIQVPSFDRSALSKYCIGRIELFEKFF